MVRSFVLNDDQRKAVEHYLDNRPPLMGPQIRQLRMRVKVLDFDQMESDVALLRRLKELKIPKGRRSGSVAAGFTVVQKYDRILDEFIESGEQTSELKIKGLKVNGQGPRGIPNIRKMLNEKIAARNLPVKAGVIDDKVYLERTDGKSVAGGFTVRKNPEAPEEKK